MRILIADDSQVMRTMLERQLRGLGFDVEPFATGTAAWERLQQPDAPSLVILDWVMPGIEGPDLCRMIREREAHRDRYTYAILVTMREHAHDIREGLDSGADDFIIKPYEPIELEARIRVGARVLEFGERLRRANEELARLTTADPVTRLPDRTATMERLDEEFNRHQRAQQPISVLVVDVDNLAGINEAHGTAAGDQALREVGEAIQSSCRIYDVAGRYGGDEFIVGLPGANEVAASIVAERITSHDLMGSSGESTYPITASIGVATWRHDSSMTPRTAVRAAAAALQNGTASGPGSITYAGPDEFDDAASTSAG